MRTNIFKIKKLKKSNIVLEEENGLSPFLLFFKNYGKYIILMIMILAIMLLGISLYYVIKDLKSTTKFVTNINSVVVEFDKNNEFNSVNMKPITGGLADKLFYNRYGNIGLIDGVILVEKEVPSKNGLITFYSDGSAKLEANDGNITRISALSNGEYGIQENGAIIIGAKIKKISIVKTDVLEDNTKIIYYSDNSCTVILPSAKETLLVRNKDRVIIENNRLVELTPSGVAKEKNNDKVSGTKLTYYEDGTIKIEQANNTYIVRDEKDIKIDNKVTFTNNNYATVLNEISLKDGSKLIYYTDGSAEIKKANESIMVRESKDIIYTEKRVIEIIETKYANLSSKKNTPDNKEIKYLNNGGALIKNNNGKYEYVEENSNIKYTDSGYVKNDLSTIKEINHKTTKDGTTVIDLENGKSIIITEEGYRIVDTNKIVYDVDGNIVKIIGDEEITADIEGSVSDNRFVITNESGKSIKYMVTLEVSDNYKEYAPKWLDTKFLRYNIVENSNYIENQIFDKKLEIGTVLEGNVKIEKETYILHEATLENLKKAEINLGIWLDYEKITNAYQDSVFVGTIKVYTETIK